MNSRKNLKFRYKTSIKTWLTPTFRRRATVHVLHIITTPALVYTGSPASLKCRLEGSPSTPNATWTDIPDSGYTVNTLEYVASEGKLETEVQIDEATTDETFTCVFTIDSVEFSKTVQVKSYIFNNIALGNMFYN